MVLHYMSALENCLFKQIRNGIFGIYAFIS